MNWLRFLSIVSCVVPISGYAYVYTANPIGEKPTVISAEDWEGMWGGKGLAIYIEVLDEESGKIRTVWIDDLGDGEFKQQDHQLYLTESGEWRFFSLKGPEEAEDNKRYLWGRFVKGESSDDSDAKLCED